MFFFFFFFFFFQAEDGIRDHCVTGVQTCALPILKLINNMVLFQNVLAVAEALAVIRKLGLDPAKALEVLAKGSADSFALRHHGMTAMLPNKFPQKAFSVEYALKDISYALELAKIARIEL